MFAALNQYYLTPVNKMRKVHFKSSQCDVYILQKGDRTPRGEISFLEDEWGWCVRISKNTSDPEAERLFWVGVLEKKRTNPYYSVFEDFPQNLGETDTRKPAQVYCPEIIASLRKAGAGKKDPA